MQDDEIAIDWDAAARIPKGGRAVETVENGVLVRKVYDADGRLVAEEKGIKGRAGDPRRSGPPANREQRPA